MNLRAFRALFVKEMRQVRRDPLSLVMLLGLPALMLVLYGYALNFDVRHVALAVQDRDLSPASRDLVATFVNSTFFDRVADLGPGEDPEGLFARRVARAVLVIPEGHAARVERGERAPVQFLVDGADAGTASTVLGYANALTADANLRLVERRLAVTGREAPATLAYQPRVWFNPELSSTRFLVPGLAGVLLMLTGVVSTALSVVREKERGTMEQLRIAPLGTFQLLLGKTLPYLLQSLGVTVVILVVANLLFGLTVRGPLWALFVATLLYLMGALGLGLLISTLADSQAAAFQISLIASLLPAVLLSGFIFPIRSMPAFLQVITHVVPARYYLVLLRGIILKGTGLGPYLDQLAALAIYATVTLGLASLRLARGKG